jgi:hypothetical protein
MARIHISTWIALAFLALAPLAGCSGAGEVGEACDKSNSRDECVDGAVCTNEADHTNRCRVLCERQEDCKPGTSCNGISGGSNKSCQPDKP